MSIQMILFQLAKGMLVSIEIFALTLLFSLPLGLVVAFGRMAKNVVLRSVTKAYISIMRGTPLMLQLLIIYFGPSILFKVKIGPGYRFVAVILAFSINYAAYFA
ncbi:MAG: ABC transporter permease subunit, partial [Bacteroides sp.]